MRALWSLIAVVGLLYCGVSIGDTVVLNNGATFEGEIIEETDTKIVIRVKSGGKFTLKRAEIREIKRAKTPAMRFEEKFVALSKGRDARDIEAWKGLARWARYQRLSGEEFRALKKARELAPDDQEIKARMKALEEELKRGSRRAGVSRTATGNRTGGTRRVSEDGLPENAPLPVLKKRFEPRPCSTCTGTGLIKTIAGRYPGFRCPTCRGRRKIDRDLTYWGAEIPMGFVRCEACETTGQSGWAPCRKCGKGSNPGIVKGGSGYRVCMECKGFGRTPAMRCVTCTGSGYVREKGEK